MDPPPERPTEPTVKRSRKELEEAFRGAWNQNPGASSEELAPLVGCSPGYVRKMSVRLGMPLAHAKSHPTPPLGFTPPQTQDPASTPHAEAAETTPERATATPTEPPQTDAPTTPPQSPTEPQKLQVESTFSRAALSEMGTVVQNAVASALAPFRKIAPADQQAALDAIAKGVNDHLLALIHPEVHEAVAKVVGPKTSAVSQSSTAIVANHAVAIARRSEKTYQYALDIGLAATEKWESSGWRAEFPTAEDYVHYALAFFNENREKLAQAQFIIAGLLARNQYLEDQNDTHTRSDRASTRALNYYFSMRMAGVEVTLEELARMEEMFNREN